MPDELTCHVCGTVAADEWELEVGHRGCRLKAAFPDCFTKKGPLLVFDVKKIAAQIDRDRDSQELAQEKGRQEP